MLPPTTIIIRLLIFLGILFLLDFYVFKGIKTFGSGLASNKARSLIYWIYWLTNIFFFSLVAYIALTFDQSKAFGSAIVPFTIALLILLLIPKLIFAIFLLLEDVFRLLRGVLLYIGHFFIPGISNHYFEPRRKFISQLATIIAGIPFLAILYGITKGKYNFKVHTLTLTFPDLPEAFNGFTITQISDIHSGSFDNAEKVKKGVELANAQKSDLLLFTGDLVNNQADEMVPWMETFKALNAPFGKYSIFGNHDYGDYIHWDSPMAKAANLNRLKQTHKELGFRLLLNENVTINKDGSEITLIGVENWGKPPFVQYGDLDKAVVGVKKDSFKILMSHDPSHWDLKVKNHVQHIHLTLSGHTHGMQFGIEIPGFKWSPVKYKYPKWAGLYKERNKYLYVNRGFGFLAFPGRVGIWPEATVITLKRGIS